MNRLLRDVPPHPGMNVELGLLLSALDECTRDWRSEFEEWGEIPQDAIVWQPYPNAHSIGAVILHIIEVEKFWIHDVATKKMVTEEQFEVLRAELTDVDGVQWPAPPREPIVWYWDQFEQVRSKSRSIIENFTDPQAVSALLSANREYTLRWILAHVTAHEAYHGGQAVLLSVLHSKLMAQ